MADIQDSRDRQGGTWLRFVPPAAALGTSFVLQVIIVTDTLGRALAATSLGGYGWALGALFGLSVASCAEGGAAYLMDLYDRHLLARDSVWVLRFAMVAYVSGSAAVIHWWAGRHHLPGALSWLLAGMSASALFLWSRGARWRNREEMRTAGQIDPALPRLPMSAKVLHPVRWLVTLYLISWQPVATTDEARGRYEQWRERRSGQLADTAQARAASRRSRRPAAPWRVRLGTWLMGADGRAELAECRAEAERDRARIVAEADSAAAALMLSAGREVEGVRAAAEAVRREAEELSAQAARRLAEADRAVQRAKAEADSAKTPRPNSSRQQTGRGGEVSVEVLADTLDLRSPDRLPGRPTALTILREAHGSCSGDRAREAIEILSARRNGHRPADEQERLQGPKRINGHDLVTAGN